MRIYAAAPIITPDGHRLGTVDVLDTKPRSITEDDTATLADLAAIVLDEMELRLSALRALRDEQEQREAESRHAEAERARAEAERAAREQAEQDKAAIAASASTLQRTLLPPALPVVPGLELACHYRTASAHDVGGDFYDVFPIAGGRWAFFLGDVCGKGPEAATVTALAMHPLPAWAMSPGAYGWTLHLRRLRSSPVTTKIPTSTATMMKATCPHTGRSGPPPGAAMGMFMPVWSFRLTAHGLPASPGVFDLRGALRIT